MDIFTINIIIVDNVSPSHVASVICNAWNGTREDTNGEDSSNDRQNQVGSDL